MLSHATAMVVGLEFLLRVKLGSSPSITSTPTVYDSSFCPVADHAEGI